MTTGIPLCIIVVFFKEKICGCSSSGRAPPCQGGGSEFEPRHPLQREKNLCLRFFSLLYYPGTRLERNTRAAREILLWRMRRHKLRIVCGCVPRRLLTPLLLLSVKSHAAARRHKLRIACGCGEPRRLLTPLFLLSVKSHAAALLLVCKRTRDAPPCYQLFTGKTRSRRLTLAINFLRYQTVRFSKSA